ncbi:hypothetical protein FHW83_003293 [Duganella sp. SG902]|uniref:relaxase/mobilization nuclease domain-containing protein n=1 Tax=Duganella sp. SG902 TaxID=2587016 RepID=UPI00159D92D4|nr:hypothetical protein [Duganella sp. SG902]NVM77475.1 hypothetical protein [Duganella sp. SG902]
MNRDQLDIYLAEWDRGFNSRHTRRVQTRSVAELRARGAAVRERLSHIVRRTPQVLVRISGGGRGMGGIRAHLNYIARHGQLPLEDQDGDRHLGRDDLTWLGYSWQHGGVPIPEVAEWREAVNIVLSMPEGTDTVALQRAARAFAAAEFAGYQYAMALHTPDSDPSRSASPHPHVHLCVKKAGADGRRLNPRKQDLRRWREDFAERLREHGIDAAASRRLERFQPIKGEQQYVRHMRARGVTLAGLGLPTMPALGWGRQAQGMRDRYLDAAAMLAASSHDEDRTLAVGVSALANLGHERGRIPGRQR